MSIAERAAGETKHPRFRPPREVRGPRLRFREAIPSDAEFILSLRLDPTKNAHLSTVADDVEAQRTWIAKCQIDPGQLYFMIEHDGRPVGTVRLYDQQGSSFSWGSWVLSDDAPRSAAVESTMMVYRLGLDLGFTAAHFDVRKANEKVWQYHERMGAKRVRESGDSYIYSIDQDAIIAAMDHYRTRGPFEVIW